MKKILLTMCVAVSALTSCSDSVWYQVYDVKSSDVIKENNVFKFENEDCRITYNMWSDGGNVSYLVYNKTDRNLFLVMPKSFFIVNGVANDYYSESTYLNTVTSSMASSAQVSIGGFINNRLWYPTAVSRGYSVSGGVASSRGVETKEPRLICVPPASSKFIRGFNICDKVYKDCEEVRFNYPKKTSPEVHYTEATTPLSFRNLIAYTFDDDEKDIHYLDHSFWMSSLQNYSYKSAVSKEKVEECESNQATKQKMFTMAAPDKFYNRYYVNPAASFKKKK